jgi:hypothetical protein
LSTNKLLVSFGTRFSSALSDHCILTFSYCIRPSPSVDRFVSYKDVNNVDVDVLSHQVRLLDWDVLYDTPDVDLQVLLPYFVNHLYRVYVSVRWKFVPDQKYPGITLEIRDAIRQRDRMRTGTVVFRSAKRQVADMMRFASARFVKRDFDPGMAQRISSSWLL